MGDCNNCAFLKFKFHDWHCEKGHDPVCVMRTLLKYCPDYESWGKYHATKSLEKMRKTLLKD